MYVVFLCRAKRNKKFKEDGSDTRSKFQLDPRPFFFFLTTWWKTQAELKKNRAPSDGGKFYAPKIKGIGMILQFQYFLLEV